MNYMKRLRLLEKDHKPSGWPAIPMSDVSALLDRIEHLERVLAQARDAFRDGNMDMVYSAIAAIDEALNTQTIDTSDAS